MEHSITPGMITRLKPHEFLVAGLERGRSISSLDSRIANLFNEYPTQVLLLHFTWDERENKLLIDQFLLSAQTRKNQVFYVEPFPGIGPDIIAPLFERANHCPNVCLPLSYWKVIDKVIRKRKYAGNDAVSLPCRPVSPSTLLTTSHSPSFSIKFVPQAYGLVVESGPGNRFQGMCVIVKNGGGMELASDYVSGASPYYWDSRKLADQIYLLEFYFKEFSADSYRLYTRLKVKNTSGFCSIVPSPDLDHNQKVVQSIGVDAQTLSRCLRLTSVVPGALTEFRDLAFRITKYSNGNYEKILAVHDWVARNIHYDYDSLINSLYLNTPLEKTAILALRTKKCVCQGYTDLSVALLRTLEIPAVGVYCRADESTSSSSGDDANHIFTFAYCDGRWIPMDITWDSRNRYEDGGFKNGGQISHLYFDMTLPYLSITHRIVDFAL